MSWISPDPKDSEHPPALVSTGQAYVTRIINAVMHSSDWNSSAIFLAWDDWGGFYDHVDPAHQPTPSATESGCLPGHQPVRQDGFIDPQTSSRSTPTCKFIEDDFLGGARLDPTTDGRPDPRPDVRENLSPRRSDRRLQLQADAAETPDPEPVPG